MLVHNNENRPHHRTRERDSDVLYSLSRANQSVAPKIVGVIALEWPSYSDISGHGRSPAVPSRPPRTPSHLSNYFAVFFYYNVLFSSIKDTVSISLWCVNNNGLTFRP